MSSSSRDKILAAVRTNLPPASPRPADIDPSFFDDRLPEKFTEVVTLIGSRVVPVSDRSAIADQLSSLFPGSMRVMSALPELSEIAEPFPGENADPHLLENVDVAIFQPHFAVAENGACWLTEDLMGNRVLPFICQHIAMVVDRRSIVSTMHKAYQVISGKDYGYAAFIAGPSKTADIEQSLVLGAHGPRSMTIFLVA